MMNIAVLTAYFNPQKAKSRKRNFKLFAEGLKKQGLPLFVVEGVRSTEISQFRYQPNALVVPIRSVLWHKERLLNLGLDWLPDQYDAVMWADADLLWQCDDLKDKMVDALEKWPIIQPWRRCIWLAKDNVMPTKPHCDLSMAGVNVKNGTACGDPGRSHPGFAWAARRDTLVAMDGLYAHHVTGSGDTIMAIAMYGYFEAGLMSKRMTHPPLLAHWENWAVGAYEAVQGKIGYVDADIHHLYHGEKADRQYVNRWTQLNARGYDPVKHVTVKHGEALRWSSLAPHDLRQYVAQYLLTGRKEDGR